MKLKQARVRARKTQEQVAEHCGISKRHYQNIEYGKAECTIALGLLIAKYLDVSPYYIEEWYQRSPVSVETKGSRKKKTKDESNQEEKP